MNPRGYLTEVNKRAATATAGPWTEERVRDGSEDGWENSDHATGQVFGPHDLGQDYDWLDDVVASATTGADAEFIAAARQDVPRLVDMVEAVLDLHTHGGGGTCLDCGHRWPCDTVRAITYALGNAR